MTYTTDIPPYAAPIEWYARYIGHLLGFMPAPHSDARQLNKCLIATLTAPRRLTIPVSGGSAMLKRRPLPKDVTISNHGDWQRVHWGAITTAYHRTPFFCHYAHLFEPVYAMKNPTLQGFCTAYHNAVLMALKADELLPFLPRLFDKDFQANRMVIPDYRQIHPTHEAGLSILDALFNLGPETIIMLCRALQSRNTDIRNDE